MANTIWLKKALFEGDRDMRRKLITLCVFGGIVISLCARVGMAVPKDIVFYDDAIVGSGEQYRYVTVYDSPPETTTIEFYGYASRIDTHDSSAVNMYEGALSYDLITYNLSTVNVYNGGSFGENWGDYEFNLHNSSVVNVYEGGGFYGGSGSLLYLYDSSTLNLNGGVINSFLFLNNSSTVNLYDGWTLIGFALEDGSTLNVFGGHIDTFWANSSIEPMAKLNIYGYDFEYEAEGRWEYADEHSDGWWVSKLTGYTLNGEPFTYWGIPDPDTHPNIHLIPEPGTLVVLGLGALAALRKQRRRKE